jgi:hypothetical protein
LFKPKVEKYHFYTSPPLEENTVGEETSNLSELRTKSLSGIKISQAWEESKPRFADGDTVSTLIWKILALVQERRNWFEIPLCTMKILF